MGAGFFHNKLSRILKHNGLAAAEAWADRYPLHGTAKLLRLIKEHRSHGA